VPRQHFGPLYNAPANSKKGVLPHPHRSQPSPRNTWPSVAQCPRRVFTLDQMCHAVRALGYAPNLFRHEKFEVSRDPLHSAALSGVSSVLVMESPDQKLAHAVAVVGLKMRRQHRTSLIEPLTMTWLVAAYPNLRDSNNVEFLDHAISSIRRQSLARIISGARAVGRKILQNRTSSQILWSCEGPALVPGKKLVARI
jgi:hypothetical protein